MHAEDDERLATLRDRIDRIDAEILTLLNERARIAVAIGALKRSRGAPVRAPSREAAVLARLRRANAGPLPDAAVEAIFRAIVQASYALEASLPPGAGTEPGAR